MLGLEPARHHKLVNAKLEAVERGEIKRLMLFEPPGHAKSTYASVLTPGFYLGRNPERQLIAASHTEDLATTFGRRVRNLFGMDEWPFPSVELATDSQAAGQWSTSKGGGYYAVGVGGAVHGRRADGIIIDDPMKSRQDADSKEKRERVWQWYKTDLRTRLKPHGFIILILTRWHLDDLAGRLLPKGYNGETGWITSTEGEKWYVVNLPALAEKNDVLGRKMGAALWPEWFSQKMLEDEKRAQTARNWAALYQQRPIADGGAIFKEEWWQPWEKDNLPACHYRIISVDTAYTAKEENDYSALTIWGAFRDDNLVPHNIMLYAWRGHLETPDLVTKLEGLIKNKAYKPHRVLIENKAAGLPVLQELRRRLKESTTVLTAFDPTRHGDKVARAYAVQGLFESSVVWIPIIEKCAVWAEMVIDECTAFPRGEHDDLVDTVTMALLHLRERGNALRKDEEDYELLNQLKPHGADQAVLYGEAL